MSDLNEKRTSLSVLFERAQSAYTGSCYGADLFLNIVDKNRNNVVHTKTTSAVRTILRFIRPVIIVFYAFSVNTR